MVSSTAKFAVALIALLALGPNASPSHSERHPSKEIEYLVIVNKANTNKPSKDKIPGLLKKLFLKKLSKWPNGVRVRPFDRKSKMPESEAFRNQILKMKPRELSEYWLKLKQTNGKTPPMAVRTESLLIKMVARRRGAFGIIAKKNAKLKNAKVRVLFTFSHRVPK